MSGEAEGQVQRAAPAIVDANSCAVAFARASRERALQWWHKLASAEHVVPIALVAGIAVASLAWNERVGLIWAPILPMSTLLMITLAYSAVATTFSTVWSNRTIVELATYYMLWINLSFFGVRLSFLAATLDFPLQDTLFARADSALGFDWLGWARTVWSHRFVADVLVLAYKSMQVQCLIAVTSLALWGTRGRNREFLTSAIFAYLLTIAVAAVLPSFGPRSILGLASPWDPVLHALRDGSRVPLPDCGIVSFPSFHASMAYLLAMAARDNRVGFFFALALNSLMFLSAILMGGHFLVDVLAGCAVGVVSLYAAQLAGRRTSRGRPRSQLGSRSQGEPVWRSLGDQKLWETCTAHAIAGTKTSAAMTPYSTARVIVSSRTPRMRLAAFRCIAHAKPKR